MYTLNRKKHALYKKKVLLWLLIFGGLLTTAVAFGALEDECQGRLCFNESFGLFGLIFWLSVCAIMVTVVGAVLGGIIRLLLVDSK